MIRRRACIRGVLLSCGVWLVSACGDGSPVLADDAPQGVEGRVWLGPQCPVIPDDGSCPDAPYAAVMDLSRADGSHVTRIRSDAEGRYRTGLEPGSYRIAPRNGDPFPRAAPVDFAVAAGRWLEVDIVYDTGIR